MGVGPIWNGGINVFLVLVLGIASSGSVFSH